MFFPKLNLTAEERPVVVAMLKDRTKLDAEQLHARGFHFAADAQAKAGIWR